MEGFAGCYCLVPGCGAQQAFLALFEEKAPVVFEFATTRRLVSRRLLLTARSVALATRSQHQQMRYPYY